MICCIRSKRNKGNFEIELNDKELNDAIYYNKTYDDVYHNKTYDDVYHNNTYDDVMNTNLDTTDAAPPLAINNPFSVLESSFTQSSAEGEKSTG